MDGKAAVRWCSFCFCLWIRVAITATPDIRSGKRSNDVSKRILDLEENWKKACEPATKLQEMRCRVRLREMQLETLESLLDRILICLNSYRDGEVACPADSLIEAIVKEINFHRLLTADSAVSEV